MDLNRKINDKDISVLLSDVLRFGVYLSLGIVLIGGAVYLYRHGNESNIFIGKPFVARNENIGRILQDTYHGILDWRGYYIIELGALLLLATPLARVVFSLVAFAFEKDKLYVAITLIVLMIITISMLTGFGG